MPFRNKSIIALLLLNALLGYACAVKVAGIDPPDDAPTPRPASAPADADTVTIAAVGDIMMASTYPDESRMPPKDGADLFKDVTSVLAAADIAFGNLEGPLADGGVSTKCSPTSTRCFAFRTPTRYAKNLKAAGFDVLSLANNHAGDFGDLGRTSTRRSLDAHGIKHAGSDKSAFSTAVVETKGRRVAFIGFAHNSITPNVNDLENARRLVSAAAKRADIVVVSFHGGAEGTDAQRVPKMLEMYAGEKRGNLPLFARTVIDAGADLVLGHGPHVLRGLEVYKERLIAYSLGNFCTYGWFQLLGETALTAILEVRLDRNGKMLGGKIHAGRQRRPGIPELDQTGEAIRVMRNLSNADFGLNGPKIAENGIFSIR
jgi:hypothetical protein